MTENEKPITTEQIPETETLHPLEKTIKGMLDGAKKTGKDGVVREVPPIKTEAFREFLESIAFTAPVIPREDYWGGMLTDFARLIRKGKFPEDEKRRVSGLLRQQLSQAVITERTQRDSEQPFPPEFSRYETSYDDFVRAELRLQEGIEINFGQWPPSWFKKSRFERQELSDWQQLLRARRTLANASFVKLHIADTIFSSIFESSL